MQICLVGGGGVFFPGNIPRGENFLGNLGEIFPPGGGGGGTFRGTPGFCTKPAAMVTKYSGR